MKFSDAYLVYKGGDLYEEIVYSYKDCLERIEVLVDELSPDLKEYHFALEECDDYGCIRAVTLEEHIENVHYFHTCNLAGEDL